MKRCKNCNELVLYGALSCPYCGSRELEDLNPTTESSGPIDSSLLAILSIIFGLFGLLGLVFGMIGLSHYNNPKDPNYIRNRRCCKIGISLSLFWLVMIFIVPFVLILIYIMKTWYN